MGLEIIGREVVNGEAAAFNVVMAELFCADSDASMKCLGGELRRA